ncbi:hypothetical protein [Streptomyces sp. NPDC047869]|uniref:hypothetical protein n=1 Tax=Streptomyces sp. NPDC047869 TaxID=3154709 RepID=UPI0034537A51
MRRPPSWQGNRADRLKRYGQGKFNIHLLSVDGQVKADAMTFLVGNQRQVSEVEW